MKLFGITIFEKRVEEAEGDPETSSPVGAAQWHSGYRAREAKRPKEDCPFRKGTVSYDMWMRGWHFANSVATGGN